MCCLATAAENSVLGLFFFEKEIILRYLWICVFFVFSLLFCFLSFFNEFENPILYINFSKDGFKFDVMIIVSS